MARIGNARIVFGAFLSSETFMKLETKGYRLIFAIDRPLSSRSGSYEHLDGIVGNASDADFEADDASTSLTDAERSPLEMARLRRQSMRRLVRQNSTVNTQKSEDGTIQLTYWF